MSSEYKHTGYSAKDIEQYLAGKLSPTQMHAMEKAALDDPFLAEAMEGYEAMGDKEWNGQLIALHEEIAGKTGIAKVIPLHRSKNNWLKIAAAILILGTGSLLTFILVKDKTVEKNKPEIAKITVTPRDSTTVANVEVPSVTASLNPTASEDKKQVEGPVAQTMTRHQTEKYIGDPNAPQLKPASPNTGIIVRDDNVVAAAPAANNNAVAADDNGKTQDELGEAKRKAAANANSDAELQARQKPQGLASAKKEAVLNNFFTAQVVASDNSPLPFTNISIKKENFGTYADAKGIVRLVSTDSVLNLEVRSVGYLPKTFTLHNNQPPAKIILQEDEVAVKNKTVVGNNSIASGQKSRRATLLTDSIVNVEPADGWDNYNVYVANNFDIPEDILKRDFHGEVEITFDVKPNGTVSNIRVNKSLGTEYDEAAKRLIMEGPQWKVKKGKKTSASVKVQF